MERQASSASRVQTMCCQINRMMTIPFPVTVQSFLFGRKSTGMKKGSLSNLCGQTDN